MTHISIIPTDLSRALDAGERTNMLSSPSELECKQLLRLPHPRTGVPSLFLPHTDRSAASGAKSSSSILEVQSIAPPSRRSWFLQGDLVISDGKLLILTPLDPLFLLIPILHAAQPEDGTVGNFRTSDDIFEDAASKLAMSHPGSKAPEIRSEDIMRLAELDCVGDALKRICDYKELTDELSVYRFSRSKLSQIICAKVTRLSQPSLFDTFPSLQRQLARDGLLDEGKVDLRQAGRTRAACEIISQYLPPDVTSEIIAMHDFTALDTHLQALAEEAMVLKPVRPTPMTQEKGDDKKRKAAAQLSKGVSKLMKANTTGMSKISSFFKKPAT